ncbi:hypothetical protein CKA38_06305 [Ereboglobus luteus]|uniref:Uncharacterized protein n=1 Tax=Ereboglobus luteus TaxID=1796921 RepID=A0A2U8E296_9BACT|nr:hypothetical protein CKA38_06305 [Ereboglobus luteus]
MAGRTSGESRGAGKFKFQNPKSPKNLNIQCPGRNGVLNNRGEIGKTSTRPARAMPNNPG